MDNLIGVTLEPGVEDTDGNVIDSNSGRAITGAVKDDDGSPIPNVPIQLQSSADTVVIATTTIDATGAYEYTEVEWGST